VRVFTPRRPLSLAHTRLNRIAVIGLSAVGIALGAWQAKNCTAISFGYVAGYAYATAVLLAVALCGVGLLLLISWRTRGIGAGLVAAGLLSSLTFYAGMAVLLRLDRVAWRHEPPLFLIGPDQRASLVIYFWDGITEQQVEEFHSSVLNDTTYHSLVTTYLRLRPSQANGHEGIAVTFRQDARPDQVAQCIEKVERDGRVQKTYRNIAPTAIEQ
jgi:hypothetical protein